MYTFLVNFLKLIIEEIFQKLKFSIINIVKYVSNFMILLNHNKLKNLKKKVMIKFIFTKKKKYYKYLGLEMIFCYGCLTSVH